MSSVEPGDKNVEHLYTKVLTEIDKAIDEEDFDRAKAMARRAATGRPKVIPKLDTESQEAAV